MIKENPGIHLRRISKELGLALGDTQYNLNILEKSGFIKYRRWGLYKRYFTVSILDTKHEAILSMLQQETPREIILFLIENPGATQKELAINQFLSIPTIKWHILKLEEMDLIYNRKNRRLIEYYVKGDINDIINLMKSYHPSIWNKFANSLANSFIELSYISRTNNFYIDNEFNNANNQTTNTSPKNKEKKTND